MKYPTFQYPHYVYRAKVIKIIDGDTIDVDLDLGFNITARKRLRFLGIDTFELRGEEKEKGILARNRLEELLSNKEVFVQTEMDEKGKYGRVLAWIWILSEETLINVNEQLLREEHGTEYVQ